MWRLRSEMAGSDLTWGMVEGLTRIVGISPIELENHESLTWGDVPKHVRYVV